MEQIRRTQAAIDSVKGKTVTVFKLTGMQRKHLYALGHIDNRGKFLVDAEVILAALRKFREKR